MFTKIQLMLLLFLTMLVGFFAAFYTQPLSFSAETTKASVSFESANQQVKEYDQQFTELQETYPLLKATSESSNDQLASIHTVLNQIINTTASDTSHYASQSKIIDDLRIASSQQTKKSSDLLDKILSNILGDPIGQTFSDRTTIKVFSLKETGYRGYMAKVKIHDPDAIKLVLSNDKVGDKGETTSAAANRKNAVLAINGGGFSKKDGLLYPMGITVVDGEIKTFYQVGLSFIGFNKTGNLVGGEIMTREQVGELNVLQGATFVPTLLKDGKKQEIPKKWSNRKEPRTLIGHFSNGDLLFIVIDGRQKDSSGVTLEEAQDKLLEFNVRDAYNLDGGGSSTFYYDGKVLNKPSDGRERKLASSFVILP